MKTRTKIVLSLALVVAVVLAAKNDWLQTNEIMLISAVGVMLFILTRPAIRKKYRDWKREGEWIDVHEKARLDSTPVQAIKAERREKRAEFRSTVWKFTRKIAVGMVVILVVGLILMAGQHVIKEYTHRPSESPISSQDPEPERESLDGSPLKIETVYVLNFPDRPPEIWSLVDEGPYLFLQAPSKTQPNIGLNDGYLDDDDDPDNKFKDVDIDEEDEDPNVFRFFSDDGEDELEITVGANTLKMSTMNDEDIEKENPNVFRFSSDNGEDELEITVDANTLKWSTKNEGGQLKTAYGHQESYVLRLPERDWILERDEEYLLLQCCDAGCISTDSKVFDIDGDGDGDGEDDNRFRYEVPDQTNGVYEFFSDDRDDKLVIRILGERKEMEWWTADRPYLTGENTKNFCQLFNSTERIAFP